MKFRKNKKHSFSQYFYPLSAINQHNLHPNNSLEDQIEHN